MRKRNIALVSGVLLTAGVIAAVAATPRGGPDGHMWDDAGDAPRDHKGGWRHGGMMGWFGPQTITADAYDTRTRERFARLDKNGDGILDTAEIEGSLSQLGSRGRGSGPAAREGNGGDRMLRRFGDRDGKITKDAFLSEAKRRFTQLDLNNDGKITDDDLPPMMRGKGALKAGAAGMPGPMAKLLADLRQADAKQDGIITIDAYMAVQAKRFDGWDRNKDGVIDKSDFDMARKDMMAYGVKRFLHTYGADADGKVTKEQFYKVAKERFARLDRKGEGKIMLGGGDEDGSKPRGRGGFGGERGPGRGENDPGRGQPPATQPRN